MGSMKQQLATSVVVTNAQGEKEGLEPPPSGMVT